MVECQRALTESLNRPMAFRLQMERLLGMDVTE